MHKVYDQVLVTVVRACVVHVPSNTDSKTVLKNLYKSVELIAFRKLFNRTLHFLSRSVWNFTAISNKWIADGSVPAKLFMLAITHKCCEISEGFTLDSTSEIKIVITFMDLEIYSLLCVVVTRALCVFLVIQDSWSFKQQMSSTVLEPDTCVYTACIESVYADKHKCTNRPLCSLRVISLHQ